MYKLVITFDGLRQLISELHAQGHRPAAILVSPDDKRDLKQEIMAGSKDHMPDAEREDHDKSAVGFIGGIPILSHKDVTPGNVRIMLKADLQDRNRDVVVR